MELQDIGGLVQHQRDFFNTGATRDVAFRIRQLERLRRTVLDNEPAILATLKADLNKPQLEAYSSEVGLLRAEIDYALRHIRVWAKPQRMPNHMTQFPPSVWLYPEPYDLHSTITTIYSHEQTTAPHHQQRRADPHLR